MLNNLTNLTNKIFPTMFYNPKISCMGLAVSTIKGTLQVHLAKSLNKDSTFAKPGERRYDHENSLVFSLTIIECCELDNSFDSILSGELEKKEFLHQTRKFIMKGIVNKTGEKSIAVSIYDLEKKDSCGYILRQNEMIIFREFLRRVYQDLPFICSVINGVLRTLKSVEYDNNRNNASTGKSGGEYISTYGKYSDNLKKQKVEEDEYYGVDEYSSNSDSSISEASNYLEGLE